jgi:hypothetical protein
MRFKSEIAPVSPVKFHEVVLMFDTSVTTVGMIAINRIITTTREIAPMAVLLMSPFTFLTKPFA